MDIKNVTTFTLTPEEVRKILIENLDLDPSAVVNFNVEDSSRDDYDTRHELIDVTIEFQRKEI